MLPRCTPVLNAPPPPNSGVHYYWNSADDSVSWLPPGHPAAAIGKPAAVQRRELDALLPDLDDGTTAEPNMTIHIEGMNIELPIPAALLEQPPPIAVHHQHDGGGDSAAPAALMHQRPVAARKPKARDLDKAMIRSRSERRKRVATQGALDPMDPSAYSDVPRGKWSAGLDREAVEKTPTGAVLATTAGKAKPGEDGDADGGANSDGDVM